MVGQKWASYVFMFITHAFMTQTLKYDIQEITNIASWMNIYDDLGYAVYLDDIKSFCEKPTGRSLWYIYLTFKMHFAYCCTMLDGPIPISYGCFISQTFVNYPFVHPSGTIRAMLGSPSGQGLCDSLYKAPTNIEVKIFLANETETTY